MLIGLDPPHRITLQHTRPASHLLLLKPPFRQLHIMTEQITVSVPVLELEECFESQELLRASWIRWVPRRNFDGPMVV